MLSPVSKLERAKQMARLEQRKRMDAACSEKVTSKIVNAKKRKQVERRLESHIKKKIKSQDEDEFATTVRFCFCFKSSLICSRSQNQHVQERVVESWSKETILRNPL